MNKHLLLTLFLVFDFAFFSPCRGEPPEPYAGCMLAVANEREIVRAHGYLNTKIPARILIIHSTEHNMNHAALVYRLNPEGWMIYDDTFGSRCLHAHMVPNVPFPMPMYAAKAGYPQWPVDSAWYLDALALAAR